MLSLLGRQHRSKLWSLWYRLLFYLDFRSVSRILKYRKLRKEYYDQLWTVCAQNIGAKIVLDKYGFTAISIGDDTTFVKHYEMMFDSPLMLNIMGNKPLVYEILSKLKAPIVPHKIFNVTTSELAVEFLKIHGSVVVKPASGTGGGRGVATNITGLKQLNAAIKLAARFDRELIVEKQVEGQSFRLLYLDGRFLDAIRRDPPIVIGDGIHSIKELIKQENTRRVTQRPFRALSPLVMDNDLKNWMAANDLSLSDVPANNQAVQVKCATNENDCSGNVNVTKKVSPEIISKCARIVQKTGVRFAGVDLLCRDIGGSFSVENCYVGEINTTPGLHHHYLISNPDERCEVADLALQHLFKNRDGLVNTGTNNHPETIPMFREHAGIYYDENNSLKILSDKKEEVEVL